MQGKIREATLQKVPVICIIGGQEEKEAEERKGIIVTARHRNNDQEKGITLKSLIQDIKKRH